MPDIDQNKDIGVYISNLSTLNNIRANKYDGPCSRAANSDETGTGKRQNNMLFDAIQLYTGNNSLEKRSERYYNNGKTVYPELKLFKDDPKKNPSTDQNIIKDPLEKFWKDYHAYANEVNFMYDKRDEFVKYQKKEQDQGTRSFDIGDNSCVDNIIKIKFRFRFYILEILRHQIVIEHRKRNYSTYSNQQLYDIFFWFTNKDKTPQDLDFKGGKYLMNVKVLLQHLDNMYMHESLQLLSDNKYKTKGYINIAENIIVGISLDIDPESKKFIEVVTRVSGGMLGPTYTSKYKKNKKNGKLSSLQIVEKKYNDYEFEYIEFTAAIWSVLDLNDNTEKYLFTDYRDLRNRFRNFGDKIKVLSKEQDITKEEFEDFVKRLDPKLTSGQTFKKSIYNTLTGKAAFSTITNGTPAKPATGGKKSKKEKYGKKKTKKSRSPKNKTRKMR